MKKLALFTLLIFMFANSQASEDLKNNWEELKGKVLSDILYKDGGEIVSVQTNYFSGHYMIYHLMVKSVLFKCTDELDEHPVDDGRAKKSNCYKLTNKK